MKKLKELFAKLVNLFSKEVKKEEVVEIVKEVVVEDQRSESQLPEAPKKAKKKYYHKRKPKAE